MVASVDVAISAVGVILKPGENYAAACGAGSRCAARVGKSYAVIRQRVQMWRLDSRIPIAAGIPSVVVSYH